MKKYFMRTGKSKSLSPRAIKYRRTKNVKIMRSSTLGFRQAAECKPSAGDKLVVRLNIVRLVASVIAAAFGAFRTWVAIFDAS